MITGGKIVEMIAERQKDDKIANFDTQIEFTDFEVDGETVTVSYTYLINYDDGSSFIRMKGKFFGKEDKKTAQDLKNRWLKTKKVPTDYVEPVLGSLNAEGIYNATLVSRIVGLPAPIRIPKIQFDDPKSAPAKK
ncbi:MAG: hypothetical protein ABII22_02385 [Candidatus Micrarchaeota archaeon]